MDKQAGRPVNRNRRPGEGQCLRLAPEAGQAWQPVCEPPVWGAPRPQRLWLHITLFLITVLTTLAAGAFQFGINLFREPWQIYQGYPFALSLLAILTSHEMSHFLTSRRHRLDVSLPYFLPGVPFPPPLPGTFGALIKIRSPIMDKRTLVEVGCSGPLVGVLVAIPVVVVGLLLSPVKQLPVGAGEGIQLGEPLLFKFLCWLTLGPLGPHDHVIMHPVAFAGWLGMLHHRAQSSAGGPTGRRSCHVCPLPHVAPPHFHYLPGTAGDLRHLHLAGLAALGHHPDCHGFSPPAALLRLDPPGAAP